MESVPIRFVSYNRASNSYASEITTIDIAEQKLVTSLYIIPADDA